MLSEEQLQEVVTSQQQKVFKKDTGLARELLSKLKVVKNFALIVTGIRRSGKSTLMLQLLQKKTKHVFFLNFEDTRLVGFENDDYRRLSTVISKQKARTLFFDEIQMMPNWELFVRQLLDEDYQIVITGSNATLLSKELGTKLTGRHLSTELFPFSYAEYLQFKKAKNTVKSFEKYLEIGGFPEFVKTENGSILNQLLNDIVQRDIATRYAIRDIASLRKLALYLISNIGKEVSANNLKEVIGVKATTTILEYFAYLENSYVVQFVPKFSFSVKQQIRNAKKVYAIDMGLFTQNSIVFTDELGRRLENTVYLHLRRSYQEIYYFKEKKECDFIVVEKGKAIKAIQVCYILTADNLQREINGLIEAMDFLKLKKGIIVTLNQTEIYTQNGKQIEVVPAVDFFMKEREN